MFCSAEAAPEQAEKALTVPLTLMVGATTVKVMGTAALAQPVLLFLTVTLKLYVPAAAVGLVTTIGLVVRLALFTAVKPVMAVGVPVTRLY